jgi:ABC-2 type transport system permease protein
VNTPSNALSEAVGSREAAPVSISPMQPFYWSVRRELLENRWLYLAPLAVAGIVLFAFLIASAHGRLIISAVVGHHHSSSAADPMQRWEGITTPYDLAAAALMLVLILMCVFYSADALHGERRDRSILFWKSLPVSDTSTVLAKSCVPLVVLPLLIFAITVALQLIMLLVSSVVLLSNGMSVTAFWKELSPLQMWGMLLYHLVTAHAIWPFPVYCWLILVSGWARRAVLLWAALPVIAIGIIEKLIFQSSHFAALVGQRLIGAGAPIAITPGDAFPTGPMTHLTPGAFVSTPGLWIGFMVAAVFLAAAVRLRRYQGPI